MYSSIQKKDRADVIKKCYWPIFNFAEKNIPIGIEAPGVTLEIIKELDPKWIDVLKQNIKDKKIEFIGSGYSQLIGPLVPGKVNKWNQDIGIELYQNILEVRPKIALVNEMTYSSGIVDYYLECGYEAIIMEWNNPRSYNLNWKNEWRYHFQKVKGSSKNLIKLIWADSIAFQKFQRYAHSEYGIDDYIKFIKSNYSKKDRYFPLYSNDVEIFDYRPGRYKTESRIDSKSEWKRIFELYEKLSAKDWSEFIFPSEVLKASNKLANNLLKLETPKQPIPVKKQKKYNINRWALTGRDDLKINTQCYQACEMLLENNNVSSEDWKELCYLWSSDFRTHITEKRWEKYNIRLGSFLKKISKVIPDKKINIIESTKSDVFSVIENNYSLSFENKSLIIALNKQKGLSIKNLVFKDLSDSWLIGTLEHGYYDDISLGADYYSGHATIERPGEHKVTDLTVASAEIIESDCDVTLKTEQKWNDYTFNTMIQLNDNKISLKKNITSNTDEKTIIRPFNFTINPKAWDRNSLYIKTHNGGTNLDKFYLKNQNIAHSDIYSSLISACHAFGNTEGLFIIGDKVKSITFKCNMSVSALIPSINYKEMDNTFFFRIRYSARELDETLKPSILVLSSAISLSFQNGSD
jgi:hypothetical protein